MKFFSKFTKIFNLSNTNLIFLTTVLFFLVSFQSIKNNIDSKYIHKSLSNEMQQIHSDKLINYYSSEKQYTTRSCNKTLNPNERLEDRKRFRWFTQMTLDKLYNISYNTHPKLPYYINLFVLSSFLTVSYLMIMLISGNNWMNNFIFIVPTLFILTSPLSEMNFSFLEVALISLGIYLSNKKLFLCFLFVVCLAVLNRESGFLIAFSWLIFNNSIFKFLTTIFLAILTLVFFNLDILTCFKDINLFLPFLNNDPNIFLNIDFENYINFSTLRSLVFNYLIFMVIGLFLYLNSSDKNHYAFTIFILYFLVFAVATPMHHMSIKLLIIPYLLLLNGKNNIYKKINNKVGI